MDYKYFDEVLSKIRELEKLEILKISNSEIKNPENLKLWDSFPEDFKYYLIKLGKVDISLQDRYLLIGTMIEELDIFEFEFLQDWSEDPLLRYDAKKLFIVRNCDSAFYAYHLNENPAKIHEYCYSDRIYNNLFELLDEQVVKHGEEWKRALSQ